MPTTEIERFGAIDNHYAHFYRNGMHYSKLMVTELKGHNATLGSSTTLTGTEKWIYIKQWKLIIVYTSFMELRIIDTQHFKLLSSIPTHKPVLCMEFLELENPLLVVGGVGYIAVCTVSF
jgi:hypothetical protein